MKISEKIIVAYLWADHHRTVIDPKSGASDKPLSVALADALQQAVAENLELQFDREHKQVETTDSKPGHRKWICLGSCNFHDERHEWKKENWLAEADKLLRGQK